MTAAERVFRNRDLFGYILSMASKNVNELTVNFTRCSPPFCYVNSHTGAKRDYRKECLLNAEKWIAPLLQTIPKEMLVTLQATDPDSYPMQDVKDTKAYQEHLFSISAAPSSFWIRCYKHRVAIVPWHQPVSQETNEYFNSVTKAAAKAGELIQKVVNKYDRATLTIDVTFPARIRTLFYARTARLVSVQFPNNQTWFKLGKFVNEWTLTFHL